MSSEKNQQSETETESNETTECTQEKLKGLIVRMSTDEDADDRKAARNEYNEIIDDESKLDSLYRIFKLVDKSEQREYTIKSIDHLIARNGSEIFKNMKCDKVDQFSVDILEAMQVESDYWVKEAFWKLIGTIAVKREDKWPGLKQYIIRCLSSNDHSLLQKTLRMMAWWYPPVLEWDLIDAVIVKAIFDTDPSLRKPSIKVLGQYIGGNYYSQRFHLYNCEMDEETMKIVIPIVIREAEKGCCAPVDCETANHGAELGDIMCNAEHEVALTCLYGMVQKIDEELMSDHVARIFAVCTETIFNSHDCMKEDGNTHRTSLQILSELSKKYPHLIPDTLIHDILASCLISIVHALDNNDQIRKWMEFNPEEDPHGRGGWSDIVDICSWDLKDIVTEIEREKACEPLEMITSEFLNDDDWKRRCAALIGWSIVEEEMREERGDFLFDRAITSLKDDHPRVRYTAAELLYLFFKHDPWAFEDYTNRSHEMIESLVSLLTDPIPLVASMAHEVICSLTSSEDLISEYHEVLLPLLMTIIAKCPEGAPKWMHQYALELIGSIAETIEKDQFIPYFPVIERAVCSLLTSLDRSSDQFYYLCESAKKITDVVADECELFTVLNSFS